MSMNKANIDKEFLDYIEDKRNKDTFRWDRFQDDDWGYMMKDLANRGIDPNEMKLVKVDCKDVAFKDFAKTHDGVVIFEAEKYDDHGYHVRIGLLFVDTKRLPGNCYQYGFYRCTYGQTNTQNYLIKQFNKHDSCWFIERNNDTKARLESIKTRRVEAQSGSLVRDMYYGDKSGYRRDLTGLIRSEYGQKIYNDRIEYLRSQVEKFSKLIMKDRHFESVNDMKSFVDRICDIVFDIEVEQLGIHENNYMNSIAHQIRYYMIGGDCVDVCFNDYNYYWWNNLWEKVKYFKRVNMLKLSICVARKYEGK